jgi:mRNA-degrading endonuclease RelE of RelBE toxin-antitoxin system
MNYNVFALDEFKKNAKKLSKRYKKIKLDISELVNQLESDPYMGTHLFNNCYKIRISNSSVPTGKSGGFRVITYFINGIDNVYLLTIYSKSDQDNIPESKIIDLIKSVEKDGSL